ncbi:cupin domain-containing protein [Parvularcula sp. ZS-1/3]|uniref:Cupin domain-containing protein n=1 Tax=Parvularcula mediterranea TaxID=2732508 RepID=A0A7Y3RJW0_9PROT|nr:cupin domain-containing protein [Parvularcula mediterranea]NNU15015.1 cupin domain-containing protein [Parvularcula mediterranea]
MLKKIAIASAARDQISKPFDPHIVADVNDAQVKVAKFGELFDWHSHPDEDEAFLVLEGRIAIDLRDGSVELGPGEFLNVPKGVEHRPRSLTERPIVLMFEKASTLNTGDAKSDLTVLDLKRLEA